MEEERLIKKERRSIAKEEKKQERGGKERSSKIKKIVVWLLVLGILVGVGYWLYNAATEPLAGEAVDDLGQQHFNDISGIAYNSNPPTSGPHFPVWAKPGFYDRVISDGHLIHSLEHGYIVISYDCDVRVISNRGVINEVIANGHEGLNEEPVVTESTRITQPLTRMNVGLDGKMSFFTPDNQPPDELGLPNSFQSDECSDLVEKLSEFLKYRNKIIVVPRTKLGTRIALTAWGRIDKMDQMDEERVKKFISSFHNTGPEQTVE